MTQEEKDLLFIDLCGRLPYGVKVHANYVDADTDVEKVGVLSMIDNDTVVAFTCDDTNCYNYVAIHEVKPYLFPMSSMTDEQYKEYWELEHSGDMEHLSIPALDWLNAHHFDYRGIIEKGFAIDATGKNIY